MPRPRRQHYISKFLIKRWADENGDVGVVCTYHRDSAIVPADKLHLLRSLSSPEQEDTWGNDIENPAKLALDGLMDSLGPQMTDYEAARDFLSEPENLTPLIDLARLHHARSLAVLAQQFADSRKTPNSAEAEAMIQERWDSTRDYHDCGAVLTVLPSDLPITLGAVPVFDTKIWGPRESVAARFMMPLAPRVVINGAMWLPPTQVEIEPERIEHDVLQMLPMAGIFGLFASQWMICEPPALEPTTRAVLELCEGRGTHWRALQDRIATFDNATHEQQANWHQRLDAYADNQLALKTRALRESVQNRVHDTMIKDACKIQADLDALDASVCACHLHRHGESSALWRRFMPQIICDAIRDKHRDEA
ncbi:hypothetical protein [Candidatus Poriferisodalis sp.]|uniref:hypothetical protein n=1 Tax=Candidatus Poriferisodalis sp. TaxID=3101277 RepID=UPI003D0A2187